MNAVTKKSIPVPASDLAPVPAPVPVPVPSAHEIVDSPDSPDSLENEVEGREYRILSHAQIVRNNRIPVPCWQSKTGDETSVSLHAHGLIRYKVGKVEVTSNCAPQTDGLVRVHATASNKKVFIWDEDISLEIPYESFKVLGLFGIGERLNTNTNKKPRGAFLETCFALVNGGYTAQSVMSYLAETAKEKAARLEREAADLAIRTAAEIVSELGTFRNLALACPAVTEKQVEWLRAKDNDELLAIATGLMLAQYNTGRWAGLRDAAIAAGFTHIAIPEVPADNML